MVNEAFLASGMSQPDAAALARVTPALQLAQSAALQSMWWMFEIDKHGQQS